MKLKYECGICGLIYDNEAEALACETFTQKPKAKFTVGDVVKFNTRYETGESDTIKKVLIVPSWFNSNGQAARCKIERPQDFERLAQNERLSMHIVGYKLSKKWQFGKGEYSDFIEEEDILEQI